MATITQPTRDRVGSTDFIAFLRLGAERLLVQRPPLAAVWTLDIRGRLTCHWEFDVEGKFIQSG